MARVIILGAGHNGLVCALLLARAGHAVTVFEQAPFPGGCTVTEEIHPGFRVNTGALELEGIISSGITGELELEKEGLKWIQSPDLLTSWAGDRWVYLSRSLAITLKQLEKNFGTPAAREWEAFARFSDRLMDSLGGMQHVKAAYAPVAGGAAGNPFTHLSGQELRTVLSTAEEVIAEHLTEPLLRAAATAYSTHPQMPPWVPGSGALGCLLASSHGGASYRPVGGTGRVIEALVSALERHQGRVICGRKVGRILTEAGKVLGVELADGTIEKADIVVSSIDLKRMAALLDPATTPDLQAAAKRVRSGAFNVAEMKVDLALDSIPRLTGLPAEFATSLYYFQHDATHYHRATQSIFAGRLPDMFPMMAAIPSLADPTMAPPGKATLWLSAFVPKVWAEANSTWPEANERVMDAMLDSFEHFAPGTRKTILKVQITGPAEWEARTGNPGGNPNHLDMTADQLFTLRPGPGLSESRTPVQGLYLSGAGIHPGGGVHGMPGRITAQAILQDRAGAK